jgi:hypothetical protein
VFDCGATATPTNGNVTDFSDWNNTMGKWGVAPGLRGTRYGYSSPSMDGGPPSTNVVMVDATLQNLSFTGSVEPAGYAGAGLGFDVCGNVSGYTGLQFSYSGTLGGCALEIQLVTFSQKPTDQNPAGGCDRTVTSCFNFPKKTMLPEPTATLTPITIPFAEMTGWTAANATEIVGIQWQVTVPPPVDGGQTTCAIDLRFDDIKFVM